jgi:hypothetical protein
MAENSFVTDGAKMTNFLQIHLRRFPARGPKEKLQLVNVSNAAVRASP